MTKGMGNYFISNLTLTPYNLPFSIIIKIKKWRHKVPPSIHYTAALTPVV